MGCIVFIVVLILAGIFYMTVGGAVAGYVMQLKGITGMDAHTAVMTYAFKTVPMLTFFTASIVTLLFIIKDTLKSKQTKTDFRNGKEEDPKKEDDPYQDKPQSDWSPND